MNSFCSLLGIFATGFCIKKFIDQEFHDDAYLSDAVDSVRSMMLPSDIERLPIDVFDVISLRDTVVLERFMVFPIFSDCFFCVFICSTS